ncbi:hypothetical protein GCM10009765_76990 [Fodinicola feengrottensis]|uniref:Uncharacterized protein n=1 Tax=Fodinicola feengrottensis TaxID=435914 RepID=A0ABN2J3T0_9ACTN
MWAPRLPLCREYTNAPTKRVTTDAQSTAGFPSGTVFLSVVRRVNGHLCLRFGGLFFSGLVDWFSPGGWTRGSGCLGLFQGCDSFPCEGFGESVRFAGGLDEVRVVK